MDEWDDKDLSKWLIGRNMQSQEYIWGCQWKISKFATRCVVGHTFKPNSDDYEATILRLVLYRPQSFFSQPNGICLLS